MTTVFKLLDEDDKELSLSNLASNWRSSGLVQGVFEIESKDIGRIPGSPFAYWACQSILSSFEKFSKFRSKKRFASIGASTKDDFRFLRCWFELTQHRDNYSGEELNFKSWVPFAKGGAYSPFYSDLLLVLNWHAEGKELKQYISEYRGSRGWGYQWSAALNGHDYYFRPGLTWPRRTNGLSFRVMPSRCIFADKGPAIFLDSDDGVELLALVSMLNSSAFVYLVSLQLARVQLAQSYEIGLIHQTPVPALSSPQNETLAILACRAWTLKRNFDTVNEVSHAFLLPTFLRKRLGDHDEAAFVIELEKIQAEIDEIAFGLYAFNEIDREAIRGDTSTDNGGEGSAVANELEKQISVESGQAQIGLLSWCVGVAFGRFDWRLAIGDREAPPEPEPFDPLPAKSPGMLPDGDAPFHRNAGILVDDAGHPHDLVRLIESVLERVDAPAPSNVRHWLQRHFFKEHVSQYSKSRRKAPIYWPLSTSSGNYTLWVYYPTLTSQTLYTAVNDFLEPKLKEVADDTQALRSKSARSAKEEKEFAQLQDLEMELKELRETILEIAKDYVPNHDDGVQITAAPLWPVFQHKPWQKVLKDTWKKLENGDYDWAHLAMSYWPDRVREKCKTDKSLAIAHGLEELYEA